MENVIKLINNIQDKASLNSNDDFITIVGECERLFFSYYQEEKVKQLHQELRITRKMLKKLKNNITDEQMSFYILGTLEGILKVYSVLLDEKLIDNDINHQLDILLSNQKPRYILEYINKKRIVQNKDIVSQFGDYSHEVLKKLIQYQCICKEKKGKNVYYMLTKTGKKYIDEKQLDKEYMIYYKETMRKIESEEIFESKQEVLSWANYKRL